MTIIDELHRERLVLTLRRFLISDEPRSYLRALPLCHLLSNGKQQSIRLCQSRSSDQTASAALRVK